MLEKPQYKDLLSRSHTDPSNHCFTMADLKTCFRETTFLFPLAKPHEREEQKDNLPTYVFVVDKPTDDLMMLIIMLCGLNFPCTFLLIVVNNGDPQRIANHFNDFLSFVAKGKNVTLEIMVTLPTECSEEGVYAERRYESVTPVFGNGKFPYVTKKTFKGRKFKRLFVTAPHFHIFPTEWFHTMEFEEESIVMGGAGYNGKEGMTHLSIDAQIERFVQEAKLINGKKTTLGKRMRPRLANNCVSFVRAMKQKDGGKYDVDSALGFTMLASPMALAVLTGVKDAELFCANILSKELEGLEAKLLEEGYKFETPLRDLPNEIFTLAEKGDSALALSKFNELKRDLGALSPHLKNSVFIERALGGMEKMFNHTIPSLEWTDCSNFIASECFPEKHRSAKYGSVEVGAPGKKFKVTTIFESAHDENPGYDIECAFGVNLEHVEEVAGHLLRENFCEPDRFTTEEIVEFYRKMGVHDAFLRHVVPADFVDAAKFEAKTGRSPVANPWWLALVQLLL